MSESIIKGHWINGKEVESKDKSLFEVFDPGNGQLLGHGSRAKEEDVQLAIGSARAAFESDEWSNAEAYMRGRWLNKLAVLIERDKESLAQMLALENGKRIDDARGEIGVAARYCEFFAGWADKLDGREIPLPNGDFAVTRKEPVGVVAHIIPWNYPVDILLRGAAPCLAAGCTVVAKPARDTPFTSMEIAKLATEAGFPDGVFNVVLGYGSEAGNTLIASPDIDGVVFCGSVNVGIQVLKTAAENITPVLSLELGGKAPCLVLNDGDVERAASGVANGMLHNTGQSCGCRSRLIIPKASLPKALETIREIFTDVQMGHSLSNPRMGPLVNETQRKAILEAIEVGKKEGATLEFGGEVPLSDDLSKGWFITPAVFTGVTPDMYIAQEEIFGPVLSILTYEEDEEGLAMANDSVYGLSAEVWTSDPGRAIAYARRINSSHVTINGSGGFGLEVPFGGVGKSGFGREGGIESLEAYSRVKSMFLKTR